jgi:heme exporter protein D
MNLAWQSWSDFFAMGGYGLYVWGSFAVTAAVMLGEVWSLRAARRALVRDDHNDAGLEGTPDET